MSPVEQLERLGASEIEESDAGIAFSVDLEKHGLLEYLWDYRDKFENARVGNDGAFELIDDGSNQVDLQDALDLLEDGDEGDKFYVTFEADQYAIEWDNYNEEVIALLGDEIDDLNKIHRNLFSY